MNTRNLGLCLTLLTGCLGTALLLMSGGFIVDAGLAGAVALAGAHSYNLLVPSAFVRLFALGRVASNYFERLTLHDALLRDTHGQRLNLFDELAQDPGKAIGVAGWKLDEWLGQLDKNAELLLLKIAPWRQMLAVLVLYASMLTIQGLVLPALVWLIAIAGLASWAQKGQTDVVAVDQAKIARTDGASRVLQSSRLRRVYGMALGQQWGREAAPAERAVLVHTFKIRLVWLAVNLGLFCAVLSAGLTSVWLAALSFALIGVHEIVEKGVLSRSLSSTQQAPIALKPKSTVQISPASRVWLKGPSGAGKTLALEQALGLRESKPNPEAAWLPQSPQFIDATVRDNLNWYAEVDDSILVQWLEHFGLTQRLPCLDLALNAEQLSGGEKRRLGLIRVAVSQRSTWLLDEPLVGLDDERAAQVVEFLEARDESLIIVSHDTRVGHLSGLVTQTIQQDPKGAFKIL